MCVRMDGALGFCIGFGGQQRKIGREVTQVVKIFEPYSTETTTHLCSRYAFNSKYNSVWCDYVSWGYTLNAIHNMENIVTVKSAYWNQRSLEITSDSISKSCIIIADISKHDASSTVSNNPVTTAHQSSY